MMRLQRVGRKNDPSYRIVVTDKRTGPKSNKHVAILGSYNPKMDHIQLDVDAAKDWLSKGVQPSDTVHNILVGQKVLDAKKVNPLPKKSPIVDEEALAKEQEEKEAAEEAAAPAEDASTQESDAEPDAPAADTQAEDTQADDDTATEEATSSDEEEEKETA